MIFHLKLSGSHAHSTLTRNLSAALLIMMIGLFPLFSSNMLAVFLVLLTSIVSHPLFPLSASVFYSKFWCPGCEGVDAFSASWGGVNNYLVPPIFLVARTLAYLETSRAHGTLIAPKWPSARFWPYLFPLGHPRDSVSRIIEFSDPSGIFDDSHLGFPTIFSACGFSRSCTCYLFGRQVACLEPLFKHWYFIAELFALFHVALLAVDGRLSLLYSGSPTLCSAL